MSSVFQWCLPTISLLLCLMTHSQWISHSDNTMPREDTMSAIGNYNGSIYLLGGFNKERQKTDYNIRTDSFVLYRSEFVPNGTKMFGEAQIWTQIGFNLYILDDSDTQNNKITVYNMKANSFTSEFDFIPVPISDGMGRACITSSTIYNTIFINGGISDTGIPMNQTISLNITSMSWNIAPQMQTARRSHSCIIHPNNHVLYSFGGSSINSLISNIEKISIIDINDNKWIYLNRSLSNGVKGLRAFLSDVYVIIIGGMDQSRKMYDTIHVIDTTTDIVSVSNIQLAFPIVYSAVIMVHNVMYSFGGGFGVDLWQSHTLGASNTGFETTTFMPTLTRSQTNFSNVSDVVTTLMLDTDGQNDELTAGSKLAIIFSVILVICLVFVMICCYVQHNINKTLKIEDIETDVYEIIFEKNRNGNKSVYDDIKHNLITQKDNWTTNIISKNEASQHKTKSDCWIIIDDVVYDVSSFLANHPVSALFIMEFAGKDCSNIMHKIDHSEWAYKLAESLRIGVLPIHQRKSDNNLGANTKENQLPNINWKKQEMLHGVSVEKNESNIFFVQSLNIYPVKGLKGIPIKSSVVQNGGLLNDRMYCIVDANTNVVVNQLQYQKLCLIQPKLNNVPFNGDNHTETHKEITLINTTNYESIIIPTKVENNNDNILHITFVNSDIDILGYDQGKESSKWITNFIHSNHEMKDKNKQFKFIKIQINNKRNHEPYFSLPFIDQHQQEIKGILNHSSVNLASEESMRELNKRYRKKMNSMPDHCIPFSWDRFRINIIINGCPTPHFEDFCKVLVINDKVELLWNKRRYFCCIPNIDQSNGNSIEGQTFEPQSTLTPYRNAITLNDRTSKPGDNAVFFGSYFMIKTDGLINIGDSIKTKKTHFNKLTIGYPEMKSLRIDDDDDDEDEDFPDEKTELTKYYSRSLHDAFYNTADKDYLNLYHFNQYKLIEKKQVNHDCFLFTFASNDKYKQQSLQLRPGGHWILKFVDKVEILGNYRKVSVVRAYTPIIHDNINQSNEKNNYFQLLIKIYPNGRMTQHLANLKIGDYIEATIKMNRIQYIEMGTFQIDRDDNQMFGTYKLDNINRINMICGGTGITPMYQVISTIHLNKQNGDNTKINLFYANHSCKDILLLKQLNKICHENENIKVWYIVAECGDQAKYNAKIAKVGRIDKELLKTKVFSEGNQTISLLCGPDDMIIAMRTILREIGFINGKRLLWFF